MKRYDSYKDSGVEWIGEIPLGWECIRLRMIGVFSSSGIDKKSVDGEITVKMVNYTDIIKSRTYFPIQTGLKEYMTVTTPASKLNEHRLERGDMVFIPSSETKEDLGFSSLIDFDEPDIVYSYHILRFKTKRQIHHYFKKYFINHHSVLNQFSMESKGTTRQIISRDVFNNVRVVLPPLPVQQQIVDYLDKKTSQIDEFIQKKLQKISLLKEYRTALINQVVTKGLNPNAKLKESGVEWIGEIPSHWKVTKHKYNLSILSGFPFKSELFDKLQGFPLIRIRDITTGKLETFYKGKVLPEYIVSKGDLLVGMDGDYNIRWWESDKGLLNQRCCSIKESDTLSRRFLYYLLPIELKILNDLTYYTTVKHLSISDIYNTITILPPLAEQQQIADHLDKKTSQIDLSIQTEEKKIELLKDYRQSLISSVVTGKIKVF